MAAKKKTKKDKEEVKSDRVIKLEALISGATNRIKDSSELREVAQQKMKIEQWQAELNSIK